jgi:hypothetical protein
MHFPINQKFYILEFTTTRDTLGNWMVIELRNYYMLFILNKLCLKGNELNFSKCMKVHDSDQDIS